MIVGGSGFHPEDSFAGFHEIQFVAGQEFGVSRIVLQQRQFFALFVIAGSFLFHLLFQILQSMLLTLPLLDQRQEPAGQENESCDQYQKIKNPS